MLRGQSRREVGHGALAERALEPVIPAEESFPYAIRVVSEALSSNGSTSMGSVCGSTLALMDAGVPIKAPVSGVAMGLITDETGRYQILTDIQGTEDHLGDMDFKVAGTAAGITALQMDIKISGLSTQMMKEALAQAHTARMSIMEKMLEALPEARAELKPHAPRIITVKIPIDKIGALIGPGGKNIRALQEETHTKIDIQEDGTVYIASTDSVGAKIAQERVAGLTESVVVGNIYTGKVVRIEAFGAFVNLLPGMDGLQVLKEGRQRELQTPVLLLTARGTVGDRIVGRNSGADDYLPKPFDLDELEARLRALVRRNPDFDERSTPAEQMLGTLRHDKSSGAIYHLDKVLELTPRELALMQALMAKPGHAVSKEQLFELVFPGEQDVQYEAIEVVVYRLRKKLAGTRTTLMTLRGLGYLLKADT